jgi:hypothetical protein
MHQNFIITKPLPEHAKILLRGQGRDLLTFLLFREGRLLPDFSWEIGQQSIRPESDDVILTGNAKKLTILELLEPKSIELEIEELVTRKVPILSDVQIRPLPGYTIVNNITIEPDHAWINGPKSIVDTCNKIMTETAVWEGMRRSFRKQIELVPPQNRLTKLVDHKTWISANVQKLMEKRITSVPVKVTNLPPQVKALVIPSHLSLIIDGGVDVVSAVSAKDIIAYIDYQRHRSSEEHDYPAYIEPLPGIRYRDIEPKRFKVVLEREQ